MSHPCHWIAPSSTTCVAALSCGTTPKEGVAARSRDALDRGKAVLYERLAVLADAMSGRSLGTDLTDAVERCFKQKRIDDWPNPPEQYASDHQDELLAVEETLGAALDEQLKDFGRDALRGRVERGRRLERPIRKDLLIRYLGFPLWDAVMFPVQSVADAGERDAIEITRFSPDEAAAIGDTRATLAGTKLGHFGAFFDAAGRKRATTSGAVCTAQSA